MESAAPVAVGVEGAGERIRLRPSLWPRLALAFGIFLASVAVALAVGPAGVSLQDTIAVLPGETIDVAFRADNPGQWMFPCHNGYHIEAGMMGQINYVAR